MGAEELKWLYGQSARDFIALHHPLPTHTHSALDCYRVGRLAYEEKNWKKARDWMKEALHKFEDGK